MSGLLKRIFGSKSENTIETLNRGILVCENCSRKLNLEHFEPLSLQACPSCKEPNFIPMLIGAYWLEKPLGGGGMGAVYRGSYVDDNGDKCYCAVKILPRDHKDSPHLILNLQKEIDTMNSIGAHPSIASVINSGEVNGEIYLATQFLEGDRLDIKLARQGKIAEDEVILTALRMLSALTHIYKCGYLFRDMKPQNIIMTEYGACLFDFGISLEVDEALEAQNNAQGSALYYPPERLSGEGERPNSEIYSLGMVMYHVLSGSPYFTAKDIETITQLNVRKSRLMKPKDKNRKDISEDMSVIIERMILRDPYERYQNFADVESALIDTLQRRLQQS
ncbi:MAG: serine/threonine protein kinase [Lentisphaeria bacterium]|nr:serine/threonine protein kinase [Lentisphaeria bacterium]NQZ71101.1 serine/threonine protein kinase [Lentisphaeria bacterium]